MAAADQAVSRWKKLIYLVVFVFLAIQFVPVDRSNPPVKKQPNWDSPTTEAYARRACFDCHSNETTWPWYAYIAPISWRIADHVHEGREEFNMSEWKPGKGDEAAKEVRKNKMPLDDYLWLHSEAKLTEEEKVEFLRGLIATFGEKKKGEPSNGEEQESESEEEHNN